MNLYREGTNELVELPAMLTDFRGDVRDVVRISHYSGGGSSGKVELSDRRMLYPGVFRCYIAAEPKS